MAPAPVARRISYVIPPPSGPPTRLVLPTLDTPRRGRTVPLVIPHDVSLKGNGPANHINSEGISPHRSSSSVSSAGGSPPQHRLGVSALAIDMSTVFSGKSSPEGILYSAGRDGLVLSWKIGVPTRPRRQKPRGRVVTTGSHRKGDWKAMTGWDEDEGASEHSSIDSDNDSEMEFGDLDDADNEPLLPGVRPHRETLDKTIPFEKRWEVDSDRASDMDIRSSFRVGVQSHSDWVNDIVLCNLNQSVISASNDGMVKTWSPHDPSSAMPNVLGRHSDYVRCLAHSTQQPWVASGSFDRTIKLWDLSRTLSAGQLTSPVLTLSLPETGAKASIYAMATNATGSLIATGSPERVVRLWDPRAGKRVGKLVGHTDNIRSILMSDDGQYLLTGSSDASIKIWSLSEQRCLHTFAHHTDSVWSLFSSHPSLSVFYSGDRSGLVCKVDMENCGDISEGECVVLCRDSVHTSLAKGQEGINKLVALDDWAVWTATGASDIRRWRDPGRRSSRVPKDSTSNWDHSVSSCNRETFGFSHLSNAPTLSRSSTPIAHLIRTSSYQSQLNSLMVKVDTPLPSPRFESLTIASPASPSSSRKQTRHSIQSVAGSDVIPDESLQSNAAEHTLFGIPFDSLVKLASPNQAYPFVGGLMPTRDPDVATLYSAASVLSVPLYHRAAHAYRNAGQLPQPLQNNFHPLIQSASTTTISPPGPHGSVILTSPDPQPDVHSPQIAYEARELAVDSMPLRTKPDEILRGSHGLVRSVILNDRVHALTVDTAGEVAIWDLVRGVCRGYFSSEDVESASRDGSAHRSHGESADRSPRELLETVRERIEGEAMIASWATVDTKMGSLTVHLSESSCFDAEVYADEAGFANTDGFQEEHRLNLGKWVLTNLFSGFLRAETILAGSGPQARHLRRAPNPTVWHTSRSLHSVVGPNNTHAAEDAPPHRRSGSVHTVTNQKMAPGISATIADAKTGFLPLANSNINPPAIAIPQYGSLANNMTKDSLATPTSTLTAMESPAPRVSAPVRAGISSVDYFSSKASRSEYTVTTPFSGEQTPLAPTGRKSTESPETPSTPLPGGGLMGRLRNFGKTRRPMTSEGVRTPAPVQRSREEVEESPSVRATRLNLQLIDTLLSSPLQFPSAAEAPPVGLPEEEVMISEQAVGESGWTTLYHGLVSGMEHDVDAIEACAPLWVLECILTNRIVHPNVKASFVVLPWNKDDVPALPELLSSQARLTASRVIRIRKILLYVMEKLDAIEKEAATATTHSPSRTTASPSINSTSPRTSSSSDQAPGAGAPGATTASTNTSPNNHTAPVVPKYSRAVDSFEILCNDMVLPVNMTLAAVRHYVWRQSGELVMHYRRRAPPVPS